MALFPIQGIVEGDFVVVLVPVDDTDPMTVVAEKIAYHGVGKRVPAQERPLKVRYRGNLLDDEATLAGLGATPMEVLEVVYA
ncbi:MAG: toluene-4-monooxygenase system B family protein [Kineosporiaceae bacterium]|nr:toluene-4-monooxygenase system B family protein [Kineosporiaceae bacterium]MBK7621513.1 toluene-4-monooxygenase system B family protein [Kineosporiaceae bacterium]MBK8077323.1 toluene-4-monooxygenase system B family protein [Kineosporiaceae bacterium]